MNVFFRELRSNFKSLLIWSGIIVLFTLLAIAKFSAFAEDPQILRILDDMPQAMIDAFQIDMFNLTTGKGFFGLMFSYYALISSIFAVILGSEIISKEERDKTVEFSLTMPITRGRLMTGKIAAAFVNCLILLAVIASSSILMMTSYKAEANLYPFIRLCMIGLFLIQMVFLAIGVLLGSAMKQYKRAESAAVSLLLLTYFISIISDMKDSLQFMKFFTPFKFVNPVLLLNESRFEMQYIWTAVGIILLSYVGAYFAYAKRDLYI